jgi:hypothetical protein
MTGEGIQNFAEHEDNMTQKVSIIDVNEKIPVAQHFISSGARNTIGEKYCVQNNLLVLDDSTDEIKIVLSKESLFCIDELCKVLPKKKRILAMLVERKELLRLLYKVNDPFAVNHYR